MPGFPDIPHDARVQFEALLIAPLLQPVVSAMGDAGTFGSETFALEIARQLERAR